MSGGVAADPLLWEAERLIDADEFDPDEVIELARRVRTTPPTDPEVGKALMACLDVLSHRTATHLEQLRTALDQAQASRRALSGYGYVKGERQRQRANKVG